MADTNGAFIKGLFIGGLAGAVTALLLAPQSGEKTRSQIAEGGQVLRDRTDDALEEARSKAEAVAADIRRRTEELQIQAQVILEEGQRQLAKAVEETRKAAAATTTGEAAPIVEKPEELPEPA